MAERDSTVRDEGLRDLYIEAQSQNAVASPAQVEEILKSLTEGPSFVRGKTIPFSSKAGQTPSSMRFHSGIRKVALIIVGVATISGLAALMFQPEKAKNIWLIIGPIIGSAITAGVTVRPPGAVAHEKDPSLPRTS